MCICTHKEKVSSDTRLSLKTDQLLENRVTTSAWQMSSFPGHSLATIMASTVRTIESCSLKKITAVREWSRRKNAMSPPRKKSRNCICPLREKVGNFFNPSNKPLNELDVITLEQDELEALYLCDGQDLNQEQAGEMMAISRGTVQRLLAGARKKMVEVLVGQKALAIVGEIQHVQSGDVDHTTAGNGGDMMFQGCDSCVHGSVGPCLGPRSCPWRRKNDGECSHSG